VDLFVDVDALTELSRQLDAVKASLERTTDRVEGYGGRMGSERLANALDDFVGGWRDGRKHIIKDIDGLLGRIKSAVDTYREQENALAKAARGEA
jgi:hypothetical protein